MADTIYYGVVQGGNTVVLPPDVQLREGERVEVRLLDPPAVPVAAPSPEDLFQQRLLELGLLHEIKAFTPDPPGLDRTSIRAQGQPISEQIIEERR